MKHSFFIKSYFPIQFIVLGGGLILIGLFTILSKPFLGVAALLFGILFISTHYKIDIDMRKKVCHDFLWILGFKKGEKISFDEVDCVFITSTSQGQEWGPVSVRFHNKVSVYYAFIKFSDGSKMMLKEATYKPDLKKEVRQFARKINVELKDFTLANN